jgi:hypothetical protein
VKGTKVACQKNMSVARYDKWDCALPFPILRALAYRAGVTQQLDAATCAAVSNLLDEWLRKIVKDALEIVYGERDSLTVSWMCAWTAIAREPTGSLKHLFTNYNAFKKVPTFRVNGSLPLTAREIHDIHVKWKAEGNQGDFFDVDPDRAKEAIWDEEDELDRDLTEQEKDALLNEIRVGNEKARDACAEYANQVPAPGSVDLSRDETHGGNDGDDDDNNDEEVDHGVGDAESDADYECDDGDDDDDDDAAADDADADDADDIDGHSDSSECASVVDESLDLWAHQMRPALDAVTLEYKQDEYDDTPRPEWANELVSGKIGDEDTSESDRERAVAYWRDETSDCLACPIFIVKDLVRKPLRGYMLERFVTRDAMTLFHFAVEYYVVSLFAQKNAPASEAQASVAAAKERARLRPEALAATADKEAALWSEVAALKAEKVELVRSAKERATRMKAVEKALKAQVARLRRPFVAVATRSMRKRTPPTNPPAEEGKRVRRR